MYTFYQKKLSSFYNFLHAVKMMNFFRRRVFGVAIGGFLFIQLKGGIRI